MLTIHKTNDYDQFGFIRKNRPPVPKALLESLQKKDMLQSHPIICIESKKTDKLLVVDGQNRLVAAQKLKLPIYYVVDPTLTEDDIAQCQVQNPWDLANFLHFYSGTHSEYELIQKIMDFYPFPIHFVIATCSSQLAPYKHFREGTYILRKDKGKLRKYFEQMSQILIIIKDLNSSLGRKAIKVSSNGYHALWNMMNMPDYNHEQMLHKCVTNKDKLIISFQFKEIDNIFDGLKNKVYNFNAKKEEKKMNSSLTRKTKRRDSLLMNDDWAA